MFEIKEVSNVEATGRLFAAGLLSAGSVVGLSCRSLRSWPDKLPP